jgi:hypothetical protein
LNLITNALINRVTYCLEVKSRVEEGKELGPESNPPTTGRLTEDRTTTVKPVNTPIGMEVKKPNVN